ncbi:MAG: tetratricopeptide repeat protein [Candidatus Omnitrophota bacterium]|nr:tetratricopeptide repeat protein [Candidatus Omnitrophota bacterium]
MSERKTFFIVFFAFFFLLIAFSAGLCEEKTRAAKLKDIERAMISDGDYKGSIDELGPILEAVPKEPRAYLDMGLAHYGLMEYEKAYGYFKGSGKMGAAREVRELALYAISRIDENRGTLKAIEDANETLKETEGDADDLLLERMAAWHLTMINGLMGEKYYYPSIVMPHIIWLKENMPDLPGLHVFSADVYYSAMFYKKATEDYRKAIEEDPENPRLYRTLADCFVAMGDFDEAQEHYDKTIDIYKKQDIKENIPEILRIENIRRALPRRYKDISEMVKQERYAEAEEICRKRISLNHSDYAAITQLGQIYWEKGQRRAAIRLFRKVTRFAPDYPPAHLYLGKAYFFERKPEKGFAEFDIFKEKMELLPGMDEDTTDFYVLALEYISYRYFGQKRYEDAMAECKKIIEFKPDDQRARYNLAVCYYVYRHNRSRAYTELKKVIEIDSHTRMADMARFYIDYMRRNPDARVIGDFTFLEED